MSDALMRFNLFVIAITLLAFALYRVLIARERGLNLVVPILWLLCCLANLAVSMTTGTTEYTAAILDGVFGVLFVVFMVISYRQEEKQRRAAFALWRAEVEEMAARLHEATMAAEQGEEDNDGH